MGRAETAGSFVSSVAKGFAFAISAMTAIFPKLPQQITRNSSQQFTRERTTLAQHTD
jgi:hypothetical protein